MKHRGFLLGPKFRKAGTAPGQADGVVAARLFGAFRRALSGSGNLAFFSAWLIGANWYIVQKLLSRDIFVSAGSDITSNNWRKTYE